MAESDPIGPVRYAGKQGFLNKNGEFIIEPRFDDVGRFDEGLAWYRENGRFGFIDTNGSVVIPPQWESNAAVGPYFSCGLAAVGKPGAMGYIDRSGQRAFAGQFAHCGDFVGDMAIVRGRSSTGFSILNRGGGLPSELNGVYEAPDFISTQPGWSWDFFLCHFLVERRVLVGGINWKGEVLFNPRFPWMTNFWDHVAGYCEQEDNSQGLFGLISMDGTIVRRPFVSRMGGFSEGLARAGRSTREFGYINTEGEWVIDPQFSRAEDFSEGLACVTLNRKQGYINSKGELVIQTEFDRACPFRGDVAEVEIGRLHAWIDRSGSRIWEGDAECP